jgi:phosphoribosyl 1,2-cyclic phosphodiesterase
MHLKFWGTRGSIATPGKSTVRYGGNTPCTELRLKDNRLIILDAGTGIRNLGDKLVRSKKPIEAHVFITHPHWDHIQGFPFFKPAFIAGNEFTIVGGENDKVSLRNMINDQMNKIYFPLQMNDLRAALKFQRVGEEEINVYGVKVKTMYVNHPSFALGYRITEGNRTLVYISDNEPFDKELAMTVRNVQPEIIQQYIISSNGDQNQRLYDFVRDADLLIHDTTYTPQEYKERMGWGHSDYLFTLRVAAQGNVKRLVLFHHDPSHDDEAVDEIYAKCKEEIRKRKYTFECLPAIEGMELTV